MPVSAVLGLPPLRGHGPLVTALAVDAIGSGVTGPLMLLFLTRVAGLELGAAGLLLTVAGLGSLVVPAVVGAVISRTGPRNLVIAAQFAQAVAMAGFLLSREWLPLAVFAVLAAVGLRVFWSAIFGLIAVAADDADATDHDKWFALTGMVQGGGWAVGALLAGGLLLIPGAAPYLIALGLNALSFLVSGLLLLRERADQAPSVAAASDPARSILSNGPYLGLIVVNTLFATCSVLLTTGLPVFIVDGLNAPGWLVGPLLALDLVLLATGQGLAVRRFASWRRVRVLAMAGMLWTVWGLVMALSAAVASWWIVPVLVSGVLIFAAAELIHAPFSMALAAKAAPVAARASYLSNFQYSFAVAIAVAPGGFALLFELGSALPWVAISVVAIAATVGIVLLDRVLPGTDS